MAHPTVDHAAVAGGDDGPGGKQLVAYVVAVPGAIPQAETPRHLGQLLPDYMVPAMYVTLAKLPLTANGKLDREALPGARPPRAAFYRRRAPARK